MCCVPQLVTPSHRETIIIKKKIKRCNIKLQKDSQRAIMLDHLIQSGATRFIWTLWRHMRKRYRASLTILTIKAIGRSCYKKNTRIARQNSVLLWILLFFWFMFRIKRGCQEMHMSSDLQSSRTGHTDFCPATWKYFWSWFREHNYIIYSNAATTKKTNAKKKKKAHFISDYERLQAHSFKSVLYINKIK